MASEKLSRLVISLLIVAGFLVGFIGYCVALIHWVQTISSSDLNARSISVIAETAVLLIYTSLGIRFCRRKINLF